MRRSWIEWLVISVTAGAVLAGCATRKDKLLPQGSATMREVWDQNAAVSAQGNRTALRLIEARQSLRRPLNDEDTRALKERDQGYTRTAQQEIHQQFRRLPNPDLVMYVFPHLAGSESVPIPGYSTVFPLHGRVIYAMPGERIEDY